MRERFERQQRETEENYNKHMRELGADSLEIHAENEGLTSEVKQLVTYLNHLLWYSLSVDNKLEEVRCQKRILGDIVAR